MIKKQIKLYELYNILGNTIRSGLLLWKVDSERLNDIKNHTFDLLLLARLLKESIEYPLDFNKIEDYIFVHDLPEAITGDITAFEGIEKEKRQAVTKTAIDYLEKTFGNMLHIKESLQNYENLVDIESKFVHMIDKTHSSIEFIQHDSEKRIDINNKDIIPALSELPLIKEAKRQGQSVSDIFYHFHRKAVVITDQECQKYHLSRKDAEKITKPILTFIDTFYEQMKSDVLKNNIEDFPSSATIYAKRNL